MHNKITIQRYEVYGSVYGPNSLTISLSNVPGDVSLHTHGSGYMWGQPTHTRKELNKFVMALTTYFPQLYNAKADFKLYE